MTSTYSCSYQIDDDGYASWQVVADGQTIASDTYDDLGSAMEAAERVVREWVSVGEIAADIVGDGDGTDVLDAWEAFEPALSARGFRWLAEALEICPTHHCDEQICADDEADCDAGRRAS